MAKNSQRLIIPIVAAVLSVTAFGAAPPSSEQLEFFEKNVRPVLAEKCYQCHSAQTTTVFAGLYLDSRAGAMKGSDAGVVIVPGDPEGSRLIQALEGKLPVPMPPTGPLPANQIASFKEWIRAGAAWPDEASPTVAPSASGFNLEQRREDHWAWHPVKAVNPPTVKRDGWTRGTVDRFLLAKLEDKGLEPAADAERHVLIRRLTFDLTGLPPTPEEIEAFVSDSSADAYEKLVDRLLESPRFGERWARHWMDLVRYSESHGSEGDPDTVEAWQYRDYLIRALNADVPYDQLIREHLAGDLLPKPRINQAEKINESIIGTAHLRMVEHGFQPVDPWEDRVKWTDNQIDVFSKAFQGLTVSCARCHDHKFDAISQKDFYALFGVFKGARPIQATMDDPEYLHRNWDELDELKGRIRGRLGEAWRAAAKNLDLSQAQEPPVLEEQEVPEENGDDVSVLTVDRLGSLSNALTPWFALKDKQGSDFQSTWKDLSAKWQQEAAERRKFNAENFKRIWDVSGDDYQDWLTHGVGLPDKPSPAGEFYITLSDDQIVNGIYESGVYTHLLSRKHNGILQSPRFKIETDAISFRMLGENFAPARLMIENYAVPRAGIYHQRYNGKTDTPTWVTWDTTFWKGFSAYIEFATLDDATNTLIDLEQTKMKPRPQPRLDGRSYFGAGQVWFHDNEHSTPKEENLPILQVLGAKAPRSVEDLTALYRALASQAVEAWIAGTIDNRQARFLDDLVRQGLLPNSVEVLPDFKPLIAEYRRLEDEVPVPRRAPGVIEEASPPQELLVRGNHQNFGDPVMQRYLTALDCDTFENPKTVRLRLAQEVASAQNPLTARVMVNRLWFHLFGRGIVTTVDNFGKLGKEPSHPELLDWLAKRFVDDGWSIKSMLRLMATSRAYQMSSESSQKAVAADPENILLSHMPIRRLEAEAIRDSMLAVSGRFDPKMLGPSINIYYAHSKGKTKGDTEKGPLDGDGRRSVYQEIRRNSHNPFLEVFDLPKPATARGQRDATNVPAQSLTLLNSPFVIGQAEEWAKRLVEEKDASESARIGRMYLRALGRAPSGIELDRSQTYLAQLAEEHQVGNGGLLRSLDVWRDYAQALFNLKEFLYTQ